MELNEVIYFRLVRISLPFEQKTPSEMPQKLNCSVTIPRCCEQQEAWKTVLIWGVSSQ